MFTLGQTLGQPIILSPNRFVNTLSTMGELSSSDMHAQPRGDILEENRREPSASQRLASQIIDLTFSSSPATVPLQHRRYFSFASQPSRGPLGRHGLPRGEPLDLSRQKENCANVSNSVRKPLNCIFPTFFQTGKPRAFRDRLQLRVHMKMR